METYTTSTGSYHPKIDPKHAKKLREGGKKADLIRARENVIKQTEIPVAEEKLLEELNKI